MPEARSNRRSYVDADSASRFLIVLALAMVMLCGLVGCDHVPGPVMKSLQSADHYELLSLDPNRFSTPSPEDFHRFKVLGRVTITDQTTRSKLNHALRIGAWESGGPFSCFNPRHGIRVTQGGHNTDLVICFECRQVQVFEDNRPVTGFLVSNSPQAAFDNVLRKAGVPLPEKSY